MGLPSPPYGNDAAEPEEFPLKICLMGDGMVGKTALVTWFTEGRALWDYKRTIGASIATKTLQIEDCRVRLVIWDLGGQPTYREVQRHYYRGAAGALLVFDVTRQETFAHTSNWFHAFREVEPEAPIILVGNKIDLLDRVVDTATAQAVAQGLGVQAFIETSAVHGTNVHIAFHTAAQEALHHVKRR